MMRCFAAIIVLGLVFTAGVCVGGEHEHDGYEGYGRHGGYRGEMMMRGGEWGEQNNQYMTPEGGRVIMMQRTVEAAPTVVTATTSTTK